MTRWLRAFGRFVRGIVRAKPPARQFEPPRESDVQADPAIADSRKTGGDPTRKGAESTTTGPGESESYVGRIAGEDASTGEPTGAEVRRDQN